MSIHSQNIRPSALAGSWYDSDPERLRAKINGYLDNVETRESLGNIVGILSPHAGFMYSGPVAAHAYKQLLGKKYDIVVVVAPNHGDPQLNFSSVMPKGGYETPLGLIPVDEEIAGKIIDFDNIDNIRGSALGHLAGSARGMEHSLEIQLPFLQVTLGEFKLVPIVMGRQDVDSCTALANALASVLEGKNALLVGSSDLSHFNNAVKAKELDSIVSEHIEAFDPVGLLKANYDHREHLACGAGPMAAVMLASRQLGAKFATVLNMATSGDITGDNENVVGYLAAALSDAGDSGEMEMKEVGVNLGLSEQEQNVLKSVVEQTLEKVVNGGQVPAFNNMEGKLGERWGAFVTLTKDGNLRGCIGHIIGTQPLITTVAEMTKAAALDDPRFARVKPSELPDIEFEISVLTPIREITDIEEIVVGRDGIIISRGRHRGLLLPQVATDYDWDRKTFLEQTCHKAGLNADAWKEDGTLIEIFSAEIIE